MPRVAFSLSFIKEGWMKELVAFQSHRKSLGSLGWAAIRRACTLIKLQNTGCGHSKLLDVFFACKILDKKKKIRK